MQAEQTNGSLDSLDAIIGDRDKVFVRQVKEWGEIVIGFESRNRFEIVDETGEQLALAAEEAGGFGAVLARNFLGRCRKSTIHVYTEEGSEIATGKKPFTWYFHRMELFERGEKLGAIQRRFSILHRLFTLEDAEGNELLTIKSPLFRIWTFKLLLGTEEVGRISKKWSGMLKEMFSDADNFGVEFGHAKLPMEVKKLLFVAVFLIDFTCFENNSNSGGLISFGD